MENFFCWYDNTSGYFEAMPGFFPVLASTAEEALQMAGGPTTPFGTNQCVTGSADADPNRLDIDVEILAGQR